MIGAWKLRKALREHLPDGKKGMVEAHKYTVQALADQTEICYRAISGRR